MGKNNHFSSGTMQFIPSDEAIVYDSMSAMIGDQFRRDEILSKMLLRPAPEKIEDQLMQWRAYHALGMDHMRYSDLIPALEAYRIAINAREKFINSDAYIQSVDIHDETKWEKQVFEKALINGIIKNSLWFSQVRYATWVNALREANTRFTKMKKDEMSRSRPEYIDAALQVGEYDEAYRAATNLGRDDLIEKVVMARPKEILNLDFIRNYEK